MIRGRSALAGLLVTALIAPLCRNGSLLDLASVAAVGVIVAVMVDMFLNLDEDE